MPVVCVFLLFRLLSVGCVVCAYSVSLLASSENCAVLLSVDADDTAESVDAAE